MRLLLAALASAALAAVPAAAGADAPTVSIQFAAFGPDHLAVLPGETVQWTNVSAREHTVTADDGSFASDVVAPETAFAHQFEGVGTVAYHCTLHPTMTGEIDVSRVILGPLPVAPVPAGTRVTFAGRTADPGAPVTIERADGAGFARVADAVPAPDGSWSVAVGASVTGDYRAASASGASAPRRLLVSDRRLTVHVTRRGVAVHVTPPLPYGRLVLQQDLRDRFGWWPAQRATLDYASHASFVVARPARVRVTLVDRDGWTALAVSRVLRLGHPPRVPAGPTMHHR